MGIIELLQRRGLQKISKVKIVRHTERKAGGHIYNLDALIAKGHFDEGFLPYQARPTFNCDYVVSCIGLLGLRARFLGVYRVRGQRPGIEVPHRPHLAYIRNVDPVGWATPGYIWYDLEKLDGFEDLEGMVVIDWGPSAKSWAQWASLERDKEVLQMPAFPVLDHKPAAT